MKRIKDQIFDKLRHILIAMPDKLDQYLDNKRSPGHTPLSPGEFKELTAIPARPSAVGGDRFVVPILLILKEHGTYW